jgi:polyhydroxybutyrate depolymerase
VKDYVPFEQLVVSVHRSGNRWTKQTFFATKKHGRTIMKARLLIAFGIAALAIAASSTAKAQTTMTWTVDGSQRQAIVFAPAPTISKVKHPLVFGFHGHGGNMSDTAQQMHLQTLWPEAIVVYPQGLHSPGQPIDPDGNKPGWQYEANQSDGHVGNRDLDFFDKMVATMKQTYAVDEKRIYATGFSSGGVFSYLLWAERGKTIAAIGEVAGRLWDSEQLTEPRAALAIAGREDHTDDFPFQVQSIKKARDVDSANGPAQPCGPNNCRFFASTTQTPVKTFIHPGGHVYPPWAPARIVEFLKAHHL